MATFANIRKQPFFMMHKPVYLDYNATTPVASEVMEVMLPYLNQYFGNPSSNHIFGITAREAIENARQQVAELTGASSSEIYFTSGATESNNIAIRGFALKNRNRGNHIITTQIEHPAVVEVCKYLENNGFSITWLPVNQDGLISISDFEAAITPQTILASIMLANNETGTIQPVGQIAAICKKYHIALHTDAAQCAGKIDIDVNKLGADMMSLAGHKFYAPKGIGVLFIKTGTEIEKIMFGADHERGYRPGTENVSYIVALGYAAFLAKQNLKANQQHFKTLGDFFYNYLFANIDGLQLNGSKENRLLNTFNFSFPGIDALTLLNHLSNDIAASTGAACHSSGITSGTLKAMKIDDDRIRSAIRFSFGKPTTMEEIEWAAEKITETWKKLVKNKQNTPPNNTHEVVKLTRYTTGMGCACKINPEYLKQIISLLPTLHDNNLLIGTETSDDAAVYKISSDKAIVSTVDFFTPIVDDPYCFGAIAAANALSDIYAMGAKPLFALSLVAFPVSQLKIEVLHQILKGAADKLDEAGVGITGGHSIDDNEPKFGLMVNGIVNPEKILRNTGLKPGDTLILTKPLGTGIITTAAKQGIGNDELKKAIEIMCKLNHKASEIALKYNASACTDITGFGLLGHLHEMTLASKTNVEIYCKQIPVIENTYHLAMTGAIPGGTKANLEHIKQYVNFDSKISEIEKIILADVQTSGGLLFAVNKDMANETINELHKAGIIEASAVGSVIGKGEGIIEVKSEPEGNNE